MKKNHPKTYEDIIHLPYPASLKHPRMSLLNRAAQFSPFAALTGHKEQILETARITTPRRQPCEDSLAILDRQLSIIASHLCERPEVSITYFLPDGTKTGGTYHTAKKRIRGLDYIRHAIIFEDRTIIPADCIIYMDCELFK